MPIHVLTMSQPASSQHKSCTKIAFFFKKNVVNRTTFAGQPTVSWTNCACIVHPRSTIFGTHILTMSIINNIK